MEKFYKILSQSNLTKALLIMAFAIIIANTKSSAQPFTDNFNGPLLNTANQWGSWQSNQMFGYTPLTVSAGTAFGNQWFWSNGIALSPAAPVPFSAGGMIKFNTRNGGLAPAGAIDTGCAYIATPQLDFSGRAGAAANVSFYMFHEAYAGATADSVVVYVSNSDQLTGATRLGMVWADVTGYSAGWVQSTFAIPNVAQFNGCTNVIVMFVAYTWTSYRNIYVDNIYVDRFPTAQVVQAATLGNQSTLNVGAGSASNQIVSVNVNICGSTTPKQLDSILFNPTGTNILADVANAKLFYTGNNPAFSTTQQVFTTVLAPINNVVANNSLGFGNCAAPFNLATGDNYFWLTYDIKTTGAGATPGDIVDADFLNIVLHGAGCGPGQTIPYGTSQSLPGGRLIGVSYSYATYSVGTSYAGYTINDFIASVSVTSAAGNPMFNQEHDITSWAGCTGTAGQNCNRHSPHPPDYTLFPPVSSGATKDRSLNLKFSQGVRTGTVADVISIAAGTWFSSNNVRAWIDFNGDGDFDDQYNGTGGIIYESINPAGAYPLSDNQAISSLGSIPGAFPPGKLGDDWNQFNIQVPNLGEAPQVIGLSAGPATKLGSVRMRVREVWATNAFTPTSSHTYGETEDYDVALVDNCPAPGSKYCKWISGGANPTDWFTAANWCPGIPTQYDTALISPNGDAYYPIITSNQNPVCATLRIFSGATVTVDAPDVISGTTLIPNAGKLKAYHNVEIGEALSTSAQLKVTSNYSDSVFTGLASASGNTAISPFRNDKQDHKIQFIYSPTEQTVMGLNNGNLLNSITFYIRSTIALPTGNLGAFTVKMWQLDNIYTYPAVLVANTEVAVNDVAPVILPSTGAVLPTTCFGPATLTIPAITANVTTPITINFTTRYLVNTSKYLCIEITRDNAFTLGVAYPVLYESSLLRNCLSLTNVNNSVSASSNASFITGIGTAPGGAGAVINNGILNNGTFVNGGISSPYAYIAGATYVFRPTSKLGFVKQYSKYPIEVGGNWLNNNSSGPAGFQAGWSTVKMLNNYVALLHPNNDIDTIGGGTPTAFNELEVNDANGLLMKVQGIANGNLGVTCDSSLILTSGQLDLNQHKVFINNPLTWGIQRTAGTILSENSSNFNKVEWKINTTPGAHLIPFGFTTAPADYVPMTLAVTAGDLGNVTVSTYRTNAANTPVPALPTAVNNLFNSACVDNSANTVDRFWQIDRTTGGVISANVTLGYTASENTTGKAYTSMVAQRYDAAAAKACGMPTGRWSNPTGVGQSATSQSQSNVGYLSVTAIGVTAFSPWTVSVIESPLPLQLVNFDAKLVNDKVKVYWAVANENNMDKYEVYKTIDKNTFDFVGSKKPIGPAIGGLTNYELWDNYPVKGTQYYRLKSIDNTGEEKLSSLVQVDYKLKIFGLNYVTPNDVSGALNIEYVNNSELPVTISIIDMYGRIIFSKNLGSTSSGVHHLQIPVSVAKGVYTVTINNDSSRDSQTFVK